MDLKNQRRLAADILGCGENRVWIDHTRLEDVGEAITRSDIRRLIDSKAIKAKQKKGVSRGRARHLQSQKKKGKRRGHGSRKGAKKARTPKKRAWINTIRPIRAHLMEYKKQGRIDSATYRKLYRRAKGGMFRSKNHLKSGLPRAVIRRSTRNISIQFANYDPKGDKILISASGFELEKHGWKSTASNIPAAYLTGYLAGKKAKAAGIEKAVLDIGLNTPTKGSRVFASLKGLIDAGIDIPHSDKVLPPDERIRGEHISEDIEGQFDAVKTSLEGEK
jgi:ribosomal protein L19E